MPRTWRSTPPASAIGLLVRPRPRSARRSGPGRARGPRAGRGRRSARGRWWRGRTAGDRAAGRRTRRAGTPAPRRTTDRCRRGAARPARRTSAPGTSRWPARARPPGGSATSASIVSAARAATSAAEASGTTSTTSAQQSGARSRDRLVLRDHPDPRGQVERREERRGRRLGTQGVGHRIDQGRAEVGDSATQHDRRRVDGRQRVRTASATPRPRTGRDRDRPRVTGAAAGEQRLRGCVGSGRPGLGQGPPGRDRLEAAALAALADRAARVDRHVADLRRPPRSPHGAGSRRGPARRPDRSRSRGRRGRGSRSAPPHRGSRR